MTIVARRTQRKCSCYKFYGKSKRKRGSVSSLFDKKINNSSARFSSATVESFAISRFYVVLPVLILVIFFPKCIRCQKLDYLINRTLFYTQCTCCTRVVTCKIKSLFAVSNIPISLGFSRDQLMYIWLAKRCAVILQKIKIINDGSISNSLILFN